MVLNTILEGIDLNTFCAHVGMCVCSIYSIICRDGHFLNLVLANLLSNKNKTCLMFMLFTHVSAWLEGLAVHELNNLWRVIFKQVPHIQTHTLEFLAKQFSSIRDCNSPE